MSRIVLVLVRFVSRRTTLKLNQLWSQVFQIVSWFFSLLQRFEKGKEKYKRNISLKVRKNRFVLSLILICIGDDLFTFT